ncbi:MAG: Ig-like domain-containing protein [Bacteroidales bacterium]|nr:Ig-like domain-containing protein [Bacteroidales bacterium]
MKLRRLSYWLNHSPLGGVLGLLSFVVVAFVAMACANRGQGPQGGPKDETPPKVVKTVPQNGVCNQKENKIELIFDEIVQTQNTMENVIISPPQKKAATVKSISKKVYVTFNDSLRENTTYTIDFNGAIVDYNEGNVLQSYSYSFSTGEAFDSLQISGKVLDASTLNPVANVLVGIHSNLSDTAFRKHIFDRITKTDVQGNFTVKNVSAGSYRVYALQDIGNNYLFDQPNEMIAFLDTVLVPSVSTTVKTDTLWQDSIVFQTPDSTVADTIRVVDTIKTTRKTNYYPDSVLLLAFTEKSEQQYLKKSERNSKYEFSLYFNVPVTEMPKVTALNFPFENAVRVEKNATMDSIHYWLTDSLAWKNDTLRIAVTYLRTDSAKQLSAYNDTLVLRVKNGGMSGGGSRSASSQSKSAKANSAKGGGTAQSKFVEVKTNLSANYDFFRPIELKFTTPTDVDPSGVRLELKRDTTWRPHPSTLSAADSIGLKYVITSTLKQDQTYRLVVDSAACKELYGRNNERFTSEFTIKNDEAYAKLIFEIGNYKGGERIQLLSKDDKVLREVAVEDTIVTIPYIEPGEYYARLYVDRNGNEQWDPGVYDENVQAEPVFYYPYKLTLRAFWDLEEYWDYQEIPLLEQKPKILVKSNDNTKK